MAKCNGCRQFRAFLSQGLITLANLYALLWWIRHTEAEHNAPPSKHNTLYGVSTTVVRIGSLAC